MSALHGSARRRHGNGPSTAVAVPAPPPGGARRGLSGAGGRWLGDDHPAPPGGRCRRRPRPRLERAGCVAGRPGLRRRGSVSTQTRRHGGRVSGWTSAGSSTCCGAPRWRGPRGRRSRGNTRTVTAGGGYGSDASALADGIRARRRAGTLRRTPRDPGPSRGGGRMRLLHSLREVCRLHPSRAGCRRSATHDSRGASRTRVPTGRRGSRVLSRCERARPANRDSPPRAPTAGDPTA